jgi:hypothetical protein
MHIKMKVPKSYWIIARRLTTAQLQKTDPERNSIDEADLFNINIGRRGHGFFLGYYSSEGLKLALEKYGLIEILSNKGFKNIIFILDTNDPYVHRLSLYDESQRPENLLIELVLKKQTITIDMPFKTKLNGKRFETLSIEWMCLQNPRAKFTSQRPQLPGQNYPGLGIASKAVELLMITSWRLNLAGLLNSPQQYHNAFLYSRIFYYLDPNDQARLLAMARDTGKYPLNTVAWAMEHGAIQDEVLGEPAKWITSKQIVPLDRELKKVFNSREYDKYVRQKSKDYRYNLDLDKFEKNKKIKELTNEN